MVAPKISEVSGKGWGWYSPKQLSTPSTPHRSTSESSSTSASTDDSTGKSYYYHSVQESLQYAAESTYSGMSNAVSYISGGGTSGETETGKKAILEECLWSVESSSIGQGSNHGRRRSSIVGGDLNSYLLLCPSVMILDPKVGAR
jgi:hypothetical protein